MSVIINTARVRATTGAIAVAALLVAVGGCASSSPAAGAGNASPGAVTTGASASAVPGAAAPAAVGGSARISYAYSPDDDIRFTFEVESAPFSRPVAGAPQGLPSDARGTVRISHHVAALDRTVTSEGSVDCLLTGDRTASFSAVVTRADPEAADSVGKRQGFSVLDGGSPDRPDRVGFSWGVANLDTDAAGQVVEGRVGTCMAPAPFAPVVTGDLTVRPADLPPLPAAPGTPAGAASTPATPSTPAGP
ncbi:hypothetical protein [Kitasatospora sp. NPDC091207]|uniref:hypothetical protein n=1 Tax=Kitasatospora sp. NPDC091207 TaxID=3364083 RepID=UPI003803331F